MTRISLSLSAIVCAPLVPGDAIGTAEPITVLVLVSMTDTVSLPLAT